MAGAACDIKSIVTQRSLRDRVADSGQTSRARIRHARQQEPGTEAPLVHDPGAIVLVTFVLSLLTFAVTLLLGILGIVLGARARGVHPDMAVAYKCIALPSAGVVGAIVLISSIFMEFRHYREGLGR